MASEEGQTDLIVNYLPQALTDEEFKSMFLSIGEINSCKIIRDRATNYSYGFGFVDFKLSQDAEKAIETLNGLQLQNKRLKVAFSRKGDDVRGTNLYVRNLPAEYSEDDLKTLFSEYGDIVNCRVLYDQQTKQGKGVGFVLYSTKSEAQKALSGLNGKSVEGSSKTLNVQFADEYTLKARPGYSGFIPPPNYYDAAPPRRQPPPGGYFNPPNPRYQYGGYPGPARYPQTVYGASYYGHVPHGHFPHHNGQGYHHRFPNNDHPYDNTSVNPNPAAKEIVLFVYNIGPHSDELSLVDIFTPFGQVLKTNVIRDQSTGKSKGFGFVTMVNYRHAQAAVSRLNGYKYMGRPLQVSFKS